jgi:parallel beta-helix repeat protein
MRLFLFNATRPTIARALCVGIAALGAWLASALPAEAATQITSCPFVISQAGEYELAADLTCTDPGNAILITASDVHLTLAGHTLTGPNNGTGVGIKVQGTAASPLTDIHVNGGTVQRFGIGIFLLYVTDSHVNGMFSQDNVLGALSGDGIKLEHASDNHVNGNTFTRNQGFGIRLVDADSNQFNTNVVTANIGKQRDGGFFITEGSTDNRITSCDVSGNGEVGVWIFDRASVRNLIQGCLINDNDMLPDTAMAGIVVVSSNNTLRGNEVSRNRVGISISTGATGNLIQSNTALDNRIRDLQDFNLPQCVNTWKSNTFVIDNETGAAFGPDAGCIR